MKIMFFDYWTKGIHHFTAIDRVLKQQGHSTLLLHLGSWRDACPQEEIVEGIVCRDIAYYHTRFVHEILRREKPDVVLSLNARTVFDRALILSCRTLGIRTVFLTHGIDITMDSKEQSSKIFEKTVNKISFLLPRVGKYVQWVLPNYFYSIWRSGAGLAGLWRGVKTIFTFALNPGRAVIIPPSIEEVWHDCHLVFSAQSVDAFRKAGFPGHKIFAVGNPKYDDLLNRVRDARLTPEDLPLPVQKLVLDRKPFALVLEDAFVESTGMGDWTVAYRNQWLVEMSRSLRQQGFAMVVKLHPGTVPSSIDLGDEPALVYQTADLNALIRFSSFCVAHISTTIDNCILLDKPVVTPTWGLSKNISDYFIQLGVCQAWDSPESLPDRTINQAARAVYKQERITVLEPIATTNVVAHLTEANAR